jgi:hypothetical protein
MNPVITCLTFVLDFGETQTKVAPGPVPCSARWNNNVKNLLKAMEALLQNQS